MFEFELKETVRFHPSGATGIVIGRAEYAEGNASYLIMFPNMAPESSEWFSGDVLLKIEG